MIVALLIVALVAVAVALGAVGLRRRRRGRPRGTRVGRILVPFTGGALDPTVLAAGDPDRARRGRDARPRLPDRRPARAAPRTRRCSSRSTVAMPLLEAVEHAALRAGVPGRRADRERPHADPRAAAALGGRALRPDRRPGAGRAAARLHAEGPHLDAHPRAERDADPAARSRPAQASTERRSTAPRPVNGRPRRAPRASYLSR